MWTISCGIKVGAENNVYSTIRQVYLTTLSESIFFDINNHLFIYAGFIFDYFIRIKC